MYPVKSMKLMKDAYCMGMLDGRHCRHFVEKSKGKHGVKWAAELCTTHILLVLGLRKAHSARLNGKTKQEIEYINCNCATRSNVH